MEEGILVKGRIKLIGSMKDFGNNKRVNIKLEDSDVEWISLVSSEKVVQDFIKSHKEGDEIKAICKVHKGKDHKGKERDELWIQAISKDSSPDFLAVDKWIIENLQRAAKIVDKSKVAKSDQWRDFLVGIVFGKICWDERIKE